MDEGLSGISAGARVDIKRTDGEYLGHVALMWKFMQFVVLAILRRGRCCTPTDMGKSKIVRKGYGLSDFL
jgi:hypothetical protein